MPFKGFLSYLVFKSHKTAMFQQHEPCFSVFLLCLFSPTTHASFVLTPRTKVQI